MKTFIIFFLYSITAFTQVKVISDRDQRIKISGKSCEVLTRNYNAFKEWNFDKKVALPDADKCECSEGLCKLDINDVLPEHIKRIQGVYSKFSGPNCFNTALNDQRILSHRRVATVAEVLLWINSPLCKEIEPGRPISPGDLYVIYHDAELPLHAFTYISEDLVFSKGGPGKTIPYIITSLESMFTNYHIPKDCYHVKGEGKEQGCTKRANAYSCISLKKYLNDHEIENKELRKIIAELDIISEKIDSILLPGLTGKEVVNDLSAKKLDAYRERFFENRNNKKMSKFEKFYWEATWLRLLAMSEQVRLLSR